MKILKIERGNYCKYFQFCPAINKKVSRFKCSNPEATRNNGNYRINNRRLALWGKFPKWCPLEDYKGEKIL